MIRLKNQFYKYEIYMDNIFLLFENSGGKNVIKCRTIMCLRCIINKEEGKISIVDLVSKGKFSEMVQ